MDIVDYWCQVWYECQFDVVVGGLMQVLVDFWEMLMFFDCVGYYVFVCFVEQ